MKDTIRRCASVLLAAAVAVPVTGAVAQDDSFLLEEIVVTAQKREQNLQEVPVAVTAYNAAVLQDSAIKDMRDLATIAPSLVSSQSQNSTTSSFAIRGIGTSAQNFGLESSVGIYIDGVYRSRQSSIINNLVDVEAVEVLRGPQGTLFGKNTPSGALTIRTVAPDHEQDGFFEATAGNFGLTNVSAAMNFSLVDEVLAMRVTGFSSTRDGYVDVIGIGDDVVNDRDRFGGRVQFLWTPNDKLEARLIWDMAEIDEVCCAAVTRLNNFQDFEGNPGSDALLQFGLGVPVVSADRFDDNVMALNRLPLSTNEDSGVSLELNYDFENATFTSISASRSFDSTDLIDADFSAAQILTDENLSDQSSFSQEFRLTGEFGQGNNYVVGAYYFEQDLDNVSTLTGLADTSAVLNIPLTDLIDGINAVSAATGGALPLVADSFPDGSFATDDMRQEHESYAVFAQADFALGDNWILTAGARYTDEEKTLRSTFLNSPLGPAPDVAAAVGVLTGIGIWQVDPAAPGALDPTNPANQPTILGAFSPFYVPSWGFYLQPALAPQASGVDVLEDDQVTGTIKLSYMPNEDMMWYVSYGTGYKSGGTNTDRIDPFFAQIFQAETSTAIEIGMKADIPDANMRVNVAIHDTQVEDLQTSAFSGNGFNLQNAGDADTQGIEIEAWWAPTENWDVQMSYAYNTADFENFENGTCWVATPFQTGTPDPGQTDPNIPVCDRSGGRVPSNPEHSFYLGLDRYFELTSTTGAFAKLEYIHYSDTMTDGNNDPLKLRPSFDFVNLRAGMDFDAWNAQLAIWVRNLTDENFYETVFDVPIQDGKQNAYPLEPRTWGITFRKDFN
ncbi:MAG: TonB-dependent receptor [Woeseiaceae bacterium]|nr:TonB-dependent receptor [Woeseiaceae bacterium]